EWRRKVGRRGAGRASEQSPILKRFETSFANHVRQSAWRERRNLDGEASVQISLPWRATQHRGEDCAIGRERKINESRPVLPPRYVYICMKMVAGLRRRQSSH